MTDRDENLDELREALQGSVEDLCRELLGEPDTRSGSEWRWGKKGSLSVVVRGAKRGLWKDHEADEGGDLLALIRRERGGAFPDVVRWARGFAGLGGSETWAPHERKARPERESSETAEAAAKAERPRRLWREAVPIASGSAADLYLTGRSIPRPAPGWPAALRFHPSRCALVVAATTTAGEVQAVQLVHLTPEGKKRGAEEGRPVKQSFGPQEGALVRLSGDGAVLILAEGPETGLTAWTATGRETWVALGSVAKIEPPPLRRLLVVADDDPRDAPAAKALRKAVVRWRGEAREVAVVTPWPRRRFDKSDLNDLIQREGLEAVRARIAAALAPQGPQPPGTRLPASMARRHLGKAVAAFFWGVRAFNPDEEGGSPPIVHGVKVDVGVGKSEAARREAGDYLAEIRKNGDPRTGAILVPTHKLGDEQARAFEALPQARAAGLRAAVWRGREADDPRRPGDKMCLDLPAVRDAQAVGISRVDGAVCRDPKRDVQCPFFGVCGYQRQKEQKADLWIGAHELQFGEKPAAFDKLAFLVVDEAAWRKGLEGVDGLPQDLTLDAIDRNVTVPGDVVCNVVGIDTANLQRVHGILADGLARAPFGPLRRADWIESLSAETAAVCKTLSWRRVAKVEIAPGMTPAQRREAMAQAPNNRVAIRFARVFGALEALLTEGGPEASGWLELARNETDNGPVRVLRLRGRRKVAKGWQVPTLILDALLNPALVHPYWPQLEVTAEIEVATPHMRVRQQVGRDWAKNALVPDDYSPGDRDRRLKNSERLRAAVWREARARGGRSLVVAQMAVEEYWRSAGPVPEGLELAHHNAVAGRDEWGPGPGREGVRSLVVVGRTLPRPRDVERIAEALTGAAVVARAGWYDRVDAAILLADGTAATTEADWHPDPLVEAIRWQICEGEVVQIIGRGRGVNRTAANPLDVLILTDRPLPLPVDEAVSWEGLAPSPLDLMLAQAGVALESPTDAAECFGNLWPTPAAAKKVAQRGRWGTFPYKESPIRECPPPLRRAIYQQAGAGKRPASLVFDPSAVAVADLRAWLEDRLGELARLEIEDLPMPPTPRAPNQPSSSQDSSPQEWKDRENIATVCSYVLDPALNSRVNS